MDNYNSGIAQNSKWIITIVELHRVFLFMPYQDSFTFILRWSVPESWRKLEYPEKMTIFNKWPDKLSHIRTKQSEIWTYVVSVFVLTTQPKRSLKCWLKWYMNEPHFVILIYTYQISVMHDITSVCLLFYNFKLLVYCFISKIFLKQKINTCVI